MGYIGVITSTNLLLTSWDIQVPLPWEPTFPSFLGVISPIYLGLKTFIFPWVVGFQRYLYWGDQANAI